MANVSLRLEKTRKQNLPLLNLPTTTIQSCKSKMRTIRDLSGILTTSIS